MGTIVLKRGWLVLSLACVVGPLSAMQEPVDADRQRYEQAERERARVRDNPDYGRYDRADVNRSRQAACQRLANAPGPRWAVGGYAAAGGGRLRPLADYRSHGRLRQPPPGAHWMCADSGDLLLVLPGGRIAELVPYE